MIYLKAAYRSTSAKPSKDSVLERLQLAIELEHSTIPLYLYTYYSLLKTDEKGRQPNLALAEIIHSVVVEEMLHMNLACNVLNALGGAPQIASPDFLPSYPGPLPGGVESQAKFKLAPYSKDQIASFMVIEEPATPLPFPVRALASAPPGLTIGEFYQGIQSDIRVLGQAAFTGDPGRQVKGPFAGGMVVTDVESAIKAIELIIDQGEGTSPDTPMDPEGDLAHYYRFAELFNGRKLVPNPKAKPDTPPAQRFIYAGAKVEVDPAGVFAVPTSPKAEHHKPGTAERIALDSFNYTYTALLKGLHALFNGDVDGFNKTLGAMMSLRQQALNLMAGQNLPRPVGPSFEYQPVNPLGM